MKKIILLLAFTFGSVSAMAQNYGTPVSTLIHIKYQDSSSTFEPSADAASSLADAKNATVIYVSGRTSTKTPSALDEALAFKRAAAARAYLVNNGVSPLKIMINYISAADFIADNDTKDGRSENQRVDIEMVFVPVSW